HGARFVPMLVACVSIAEALLAATRASAGSSEWLAANTDSIGSLVRPTLPAAPPPAAPVVSSTVAPPATPAFRPPPGPKYSIHLQSGLFAPIDVNATSPTIGMRFARRLGGHVQRGLLTDWTFRRRNLEQPVEGLPGLKPQLVLARIDGQL